MVVYKVTNKIDGSEYIGQTVQSISDRWIHHCTPKSGCRYLANAIRRHGQENFEIKVLAHCNSIEEMNHRESYYIKLFNTLAPNGYNLMSGGGNSLPSEETKRKRAESMKKYRENNPPGPIKDETRVKLSSAGKRRKRTESQIKATTEATEIPVFQYGKDGLFIRKFSSATKAKRLTGIGNEEIGKVCRGIKRTAGGFQWKYFALCNIEVIKKIERLSRRGKPTSNKKVAKVNEAGLILESYSSVKEAALKNNCNNSDVSAVCRKKLKRAKGKLFVFI